jgi:8-oxo-dGTP pyrophosphatase MutT (NUDIX family)
MTLKPWKTLSREVKYKNPWWTYVVDKYLLPSGKEGEYHSVHTDGSVFILPFLGNGMLLMVKQYRYLNERFSLEFPGGGVKEGENPAEIAHKELIEETGYDGELEKVGMFNPFSGVTNEYCHVYIARNLTPSKDEKPDDSEEFELHEISIDEFEEKISTNEIFSGMSLASWALAKERLQKSRL